MKVNLFCRSIRGGDLKHIKKTIFALLLGKFDSMRMKSFFVTLFFVALCLLVVACAAPRGNTALLRGKLRVPEDGKYYKEQLLALERDSLSVIPYTNWAQFRKAYFKCKLANIRNFNVASNVSIELNNVKKFGTEANAAQYAYEVLEHDYTNIAAHNLIANNLSIYHTVRTFHAAVRNALVKSIINSGDGSSPEKAMVVIGVVEEYEALKELGLQPVSQNLVQIGKHHYDVFAAVDVNGEKRDVYFLIDEFYGMFY